MPYIKQEKRDALDPAINSLHKAIVDLQLDDEMNVTEGNLNYIFTRLLRMCYGDSYSEMNDAMGVLTCITMEHYRTIAVAHEEQAKFDNGDVESNVSPEILTEIVVEKSTT